MNTPPNYATGVWNKITGPESLPKVEDYYLIRIDTGLHAVAYFSQERPGEWIDDDITHWAVINPTPEDKP